VAALLFFASVVTHELAHSVMAKRYGISVRSITLFLFGGVSQIESEAKKPSEEFWIAVVGPLMSVVMAAIFALVMIVASVNTFIGAIAEWLMTVNLGLAIFNLLPGFPLDGGRILRSAAWYKTGNEQRATRIAGGAGQVLAMVMILGGIWLFFSQFGVSGLWMAMLGWFLLEAARANTQQVEDRMALQGAVAADLMTKEFPIISDQMTLAQFVDEHLLRTGQRYYLVANWERIFGIITPRDLQAVDRTRWPNTRVVEVMRPIDELHSVTPETRADKVLEIMAREGINQLPVVVSDRLIGIITREQIIRYLNTRNEFTPVLNRPAQLPPEQREKVRRDSTGHRAA
jgi:Zn-dependent protease